MSEENLFLEGLRGMGFTDTQEWHGGYDASRGRQERIALYLQVIDQDIRSTEAWLQYCLENGLPGAIPNKVELYMLEQIRERLSRGEMVQ